MKPEILSPVGSPDTLDAALRSGADAVYLGADSFNARQSAGNFSAAALEKAVADCHVRGVKVHLTLNTLVRQDELPAALDVARRACALGVDALIVQDRGLARLIHEAAPAMPLHASTQLSCHTPAGVAALRDAGFSRVVLAREMSKDEIAACCGLDCEIECFVHGALCMCVSGQCYLSAMIGGRSGNRGRCAQPCRLPFAADGGDRTANGLSLRDLSLTAYIAELTALGVCSLKIEGRMKRPEYVAAATAACRRAADGLPPDEQALADLQAVFSRSGFTDGYYTARRGQAMFGSRRHEDVTAAAPVLKRLRRLYDREPQRVPVWLMLTLHTAQPAVLTVRDADGHTVTVTGELPQEGCSADVARLSEQLQKTGGTPYAATVSVDTDGMGKLPVSAVNALRREALSQLTALRAEAVPLPFVMPFIPKTAPLSPQEPALIARVADTAQATPSLCEQLRLLFVPLSTPLSEITQLTALCPIGVEIPRGLFGAEQSTLAALKAAKKAGACAALCGNIGAIPLAKAAALPPVGGFGLNITNVAAAQAYADEGLCAAMLSMELTFRQMAFDAPLPLGVMVYGRQPLMLLRNCPQSAATGCASCGGHGGMTDRTGARFPLMCAGGCSELLNAVPLWWADRLRELPPQAFQLLHFTDESPEQTTRIATAYRAGGTPPKAFTRGLYVRGVE